MELTQANYNLAMAHINNLLGNPSKIGSPDDLKIMELGRFIEDFELSRDNGIFEPYYFE